MAQEINTIIVLRYDNSTAWADSETVLEAGEIGIAKLEPRTNESGNPIEASGNVICKVGDGVNKWKDLPQVEGVFENDITLTYNFGRHTTKNGYVKTPAAGMTVSEWLVDALSQIDEPTITQPSITLSSNGVTVTDNGELGAKITAIKYKTGWTDGSYQYCSEESTDSTATGLSSSNLNWDISNNIDSTIHTGKSGTPSGTFTLVSDKYITVDSESSKTYATISAKVDLDATNARTPLNNVGAATSGKIESITDKALSCSITHTGYRKPFWGIKTDSTAISIVNDVGTCVLTSANVRELGNYATKTKGLPTSLDVPAGSRQVIFAAKAGTYSSLTATDSNAMNAPVTFTKLASVVTVEGANSYTGTAYDIWYIDWLSGITSAKSLVLTWK